MTDSMQQKERPSWLGTTLAALAICAVALASPAVLNDGDTFWHIKAGGWMIEHRAVLHHDIFSYTRPGQPWSTHEWLSEIILAGAYALGKWSGVVAVTAMAAGLGAAVLVRGLSRSLGGIALALTATIALACVGPVLVARPHILAFPLLAIWAVGLVRAGDEGRAPSWFLLPVMTLWANMHGGFFFGLALLGPFALEALLQTPGPLIDRIKANFGWVWFGLAALACAAITPHGIDGLIFPFKLLGLSSLSGVIEWQPSDFSRVTPVELALLVAVGACLLRGVKVPLVRLAVLVGLLHLTLHHTRHQLLLAVVGSLLLAAPLAQAYAQAPAAAGHRWLADALATATVLAIGLRLAVPVVRTDGPSAPIAALAHVPASLRAAPVFNDYGMGGYLIWNGVRPFVDGRTDFYGDAFLADYDRASRPDKAALDALFQRYGVQWTILSTADPVVAVLDADPAWRRLYADEFAVVQVRRGL